MKISEIISELDKQRRIENITQEEMAGRFGVSRATYNNYIMGKTKPSDLMLRKMFAYIKDLDVADVAKDSLFDKDVLPNPSNIPPFNDSNEIVKIELGESEEPHFFTLAKAAEFILENCKEEIGLAAEGGESIGQQLQEGSQIKEK